MEVSKSGYYAWKNRSKSKQAIDSDKLLIEIRQLFLEHDHNYGSPRIWDALRKNHIVCSENRVARLMRVNKLVAVHRRKFRVTTDSKHNWPIAPNIVERNFVTDAPCKIWLADISYGRGRGVES